MAAAGVGCMAPAGMACPALHGEGEKSYWAREEERSHAGYVGCVWLATCECGLLAEVVLGQAKD